MSGLGKSIIEALKESVASGDCGVVVRHAPDVKRLRQRLKLTQREFSHLYRIHLETLRAWEQKKRSPDSISAAYLTCIARDPRVVAGLLNG